MACTAKSMVLVVHIVSMIVLAATSDVSVKMDNEKKPQACPFFYDARIPSAQDGLINCTWSSSNACCKRTEVTSVFSSMLPLDTPATMDKAAAKKCRNLVNYMMCYFCDPNQADWYITHLLICGDFCNDVYENCAEAAYDGQTISSQFTNGQEFCEAQQFEVVHGDNQCFKFDPTVFDSAISLSVSSLILVLCTLLRSL